MEDDDNDYAGEGPYTCMRCCAGTWNDDDVCDWCRERDDESRREALNA